MSQLLTDCLNEIFEYLEDDITSLYSCLSVNSLWCETSVRILWRDVYNYNKRTYSTLISCLPDESKEILINSGIIISTKPPIMFNYASFCKVLSIYQVYYKVEELLKIQQRYFNKNKIKIVAQEILKLFVTQIPSLKKLIFYWYIPNLIFTSYPEAKYCLKNLSELVCKSDINSEIFYQLIQICNNIKLLDITFENFISDGLTDLLSVQQNLKCLKITQGHDFENLRDMIPSLVKHPNNLIKLILDGEVNDLPLSFIIKFTNLQKLTLSFNDHFEDFEKLQYTKFSQLHNLKIRYLYPKYEILINFLEINGKNLKKLYLGDMGGNSDDSLNLAIAKFCRNLRKLSTGFKNDELETLKIIFSSCQHLESIKIWCGDKFLSEKDALETFVKYSPINIRELTLCYQGHIRSKLLPDDFESFFISWSNRIPQNSLNFTIIKYDDNINSLDINDENMKVIKKYNNLGVIKKFNIADNFYIW